ncbi:branched-chain amino acid ABC transporter permease [Martelella alba]|uniref:Branched-chain amino acid ABC transporter permease n=1 Tax=Martelella alba TaxID=2590451 RepID=A0A506UG90_9HYPH|nr:branched-chain amino acid ABC transporter permease [Martelella alba]TPW32255.1 branched-chain amino acid ABC transporter permease [Martelella alba]
MLDFTIYCTTVIAIWAVLAISLNIQFGMTGLVNFGQILPFALGCYSAGIAASMGYAWWAGTIAALVIAPIISLLVILPAKRLSQDYWALITLGAAELFRLTMQNTPSFAGGADGINVPRFSDPKIALGVALGLLVFSYLFAQRLSGSPLGRMLRVLREDEMLASTLGRDPARYHALVSMLSWMMAAAAGVVYGHFAGYVAPTSFTVTETFIIWTTVILGGPGRNIGVIIGAVIVQLIGVSSRFVAGWVDLPPDLIANLRLAAFGLILVVMFIYRPQGLIPEKKEVHHAEGD